MKYQTARSAGSLMWNGQCENIDCEYHWYPMQGDEGKQE